MDFKKLLRLVAPAAVLVFPFIMPLEAQVTNAPSAQEDNARVPLVKAVNNPQYGTILTDSRGFTLYEYKGDSNNKSACYDQCSAEWPPLTLQSGQPQLSADVPGKLTTINRREENSRQVAYNGKPLYYYKGDKNPGDVNGQGQENKWYVVQVSGAKASGSSY